MDIGFSTGCLHTTNLSYGGIIELFANAGATAIELGFSRKKPLLTFELTEKIKQNLMKFSYISIHAPWREIRYGKDSSNQVLEKLALLCSELPVKGIVIHPDCVEDFNLLKKLPFVIENMDIHKSFGTTAQHFKELKKHGLGFVLDVKHAFEHDSSMKLADELISVMGQEIKHLHVSGSNGLLHSPTYGSANKEAIKTIVKNCPAVPIILEGLITQNIQETLKKELDFFVASG